MIDFWTIKNNTIGQTLKNILNKSNILSDRQKVKNELEKILYDEILEINLILSVYDIGLHKELATKMLGKKSIEISKADHDYYIGQLESKCGLTSKSAEKALYLWYQIGINVNQHIRTEHRTLGGNEGIDFSILNDNSTEWNGWQIDKNQFADMDYRISEGKFICRKLSGKTCEVICYDGLIDSEVSIPKIVCGYEVIAIGANAFRDAIILEVINLHIGIKHIGSNAFCGCTMLKKITGEESIEYIGTDAFKGCSELKSFIFSEKLKLIEDGAFCGTSMKKVVLPNSITCIGEDCFRDCKLLKTIVLPKTLETISNKAFYRTNITKVIFPGSIKKVGEKAFAETEIKELKVNRNFNSISDSAFDGCECIEKLHLPKRIHSVNWINETLKSNTKIKCYKGSYTERLLVDAGIQYSYINDNK